VKTLVSRIFALALAVLLAAPAWSANPQVVMQTSAGSITLELDEAKAPLTVANFLAYVDAGFYDDTIFHRVISDFMIQGGGLTADMSKKETRDPIQNEAKNGLKNVRGSIAMARTGDPHSATAQFFINHRDNGNLDYPSFDGWGYAVFGKVTAGMDVVDAIAASRTGTQAGRRDVPVETITIQSVTRVTAE
jgi:cyclophilin family peptidyl-prolyl cis-trans isomerase